MAKFHAGLDPNLREARDFKKNLVVSTKTVDQISDKSHELVSNAIDNKKRRYTKRRVDIVEYVDDTARDIVGNVVTKILAKLDYCPFTELVKLSQQSHSDYVRAQCATELAKYCQPQLKAIKHEGAKEPLIFTINL